MDLETPAPFRSARRAYLAYIALATASVLTLLSVVYVNIRLEAELDHARRWESIWSERLQGYRELNVLLGKINAPGNNVFVSRSFERERQATHAATEAFDRIAKNVRASLEDYPSGDDRRALLAALSALIKDAHYMKRTGLRAIDALERGNASEAGSFMTLMDLTFAGSRETIAESSERLESALKEELQQAAQRGARLQRYGMVIAVLAFILTAGAVWQAHRTTVSIEATALANERRRAQLASLIENANDAIVVADSQQNIVLFNHASESLFDYTAAQVLGKPLTLLIPERFEAVHAHHEHMAGDRRYDTRRVGHDGSIFARRADGTETPIEASISLVEGQSGTLMTLILRDITAEQRAHEQLQAMLRMQSEFVSFASHQLRTPLSGIKWVLELAVQEPGLPEEALSFMRDAQTATERLIGLVNDLLNTSRLERGRLELAPQRTDLAGLTESVFGELRALSSQKRLRVGLHLGPEIPAGWLDPQMTRQVILNLLSNAMKYTPEGGSVIVRLAREGESLRWSVTDTGVGVPQHEQGRLFEKFYRAENVRVMETEGTGLGLYMVRLIVERSGGTTGFTSQEGVGSTFYFSVPAYQEAGSVAA